MQFAPGITRNPVHASSEVQRECVNTRAALHASVLIALLRPEYGLGGPSGDAADARSLFVPLATNADECDVATSGMADEPGSGSANMLVALYKCQLVLGEGTAQFSRP